MCANILSLYMVTINIFHDTRRVKNDGRYPVKIRITYSRRRKYFPTGYDLSKNDFERIIRSSKRLSAEDQTIRSNLRELEGKAIKIVNDLKAFSFDAFARKFNSNLDTTDSVYDLFTEYISELESRDQVKTAAMYQTAANSIDEFHKGLQLIDVSNKWLRSYQHAQLKKDLSPTTVSIYLRCLRSIFNMAIKKNLISRDLYPFNDFDIPSHRNKKKALKLDQIAKIMRYKPDDYWEERAKDFFLLSYFCNGLNFADLLNLKLKNLDGDFIILERHKTRNTKKDQEPLKIFLLDQAKDIISRWQVSNSKYENFVFPFFESIMTESKKVQTRHQFVKMTNKYLRKIAVKVGIKDEISTYTARHSFATILKNSGSSLEYVSEALGHSDLRTTKNYLKSFEDETLKLNQQKLIPVL